ncbi:hypothetical protein SAMN05216548_10510 [Faunimonas pinastri]|uniref:Uncharacterized protein n=1 Tax=Faunimonas pinastri TaxID=1855383 RepID=A0A1H9GET1_9HYPH|nr:hypothetical protein [Faunimonas pinastri]SEQ48318.1 hypothetical protein SAMN05216548_10510 [Faunimonas pinastri]
MTKLSPENVGPYLQHLARRHQVQAERAARSQRPFEAPHAAILTAKIKRLRKQVEHLRRHGIDDPAAMAQILRDPLFDGVVAAAQKAA